MKYILKIMIVFSLAVPLGGARNLQVTDPTFTTLKVTWEPADGNVQGYKVVYIPTDGGLEIVVRTSAFLSTQFNLAVVA